MGITYHSILEDLMPLVKNVPVANKAAVLKQLLIANSIEPISIGNVPGEPQESDYTVRYYDYTSVNCLHDVMITWASVTGGTITTVKRDTSQKFATFEVDVEPGKQYAVVSSYGNKLRWTFTERAIEDTDDVLQGYGGNMYTYESNTTSRDLVNIITVPSNCVKMYFYALAYVSSPNPQADLYVREIK